MLREQIWGTFQIILYKKYIMDEIVQKYQKKEHDWKITSIVLSSISSVLAGGAIVTIIEYSKISSLIIIIISGISQFISLIIPHLPYHNTIKEVNKGALDLALLTVKIEKIWYEIETEKKTEEDLFHCFFTIKEEMEKIDHFDNETYFKISEKIKHAAQASAESYIKYNYENIKP